MVFSPMLYKRLVDWHCPRDTAHAVAAEAAVLDASELLNEVLFGSPSPEHLSALCDRTGLRGKGQPLALKRPLSFSDHLFWANLAIEGPCV